MVVPPVARVWVWSPASDPEARSVLVGSWSQLRVRSRYMGLLHHQHGVPSMWCFLRLSTWRRCVCPSPRCSGLGRRLAMVGLVVVFGLDGVVPGGFSHGFGLSSGGDPSCCLGEAVDGEEGEPEDEHLVCLATARVVRVRHSAS